MPYYQLLLEHIHALPGSNNKRICLMTWESFLFDSRPSPVKKMEEKWQAVDFPCTKFGTRTQQETAGIMFWWSGEECWLNTSAPLLTRAIFLSAGEAVDWKSPAKTWPLILIGGRHEKRSVQVRLILVEPLWSKRTDQSYDLFSFLVRFMSWLAVILNNYSNQRHELVVPGSKTPEGFC